jgi:heptaprenyl diphosphate synthase
VWEKLPALRAELELFEQSLREEFHARKSIGAYLDALSLRVIGSGGKRLRPAMLIASAMMGAYDREKVMHAAKSIELLHTATLVHDDIIDNAPLRRSTPTLNATEGVHTALFAGDYIYVKSVLALAESGLPLQYLREVARAVEAVCVGEVEQYRGRGSIPGFKTYVSRAVRKTGVLFAASCAVGAHLGGLGDEHVKQAGRLGGYFGIAFQIRDDLMDMLETPEAIGKPVGNDLKEGVVTLPVMLAAARSPQLRERVEALLHSGQAGQKEILGLLGAVVGAGGASEAKAVMARYVSRAQRALDRLPETPGRAMLAHILHATYSNS